LDYVDIFYHHRTDPDTPLEETMSALDHIVRQCKALYVGISQYSPEDTAKASKILKDMGTPCLIHQPRYSMLDRWVENGLLKVLSNEGIGAIAFSPLEQGILTDKYLNGIPKDSRAYNDTSYLGSDQISPELLNKVSKLNDIALSREQSLAQMSIAWILRNPEITTVLVGVSRPEQLLNNIESLENLDFSTNELERIELILNE
jgi:L-glyceraldehyde 3-phosphate reductase